MESLLWNKFKESCPSYYRFFKTWKSRLKPEKKHWLLTIAYIVIVGGVALFDIINENPLVSDIVSVFFIVFVPVFYFIACKYLEVKRLSDFVPLASAVAIVYLFGFLFFPLLLAIKLDFFHFVQSLFSGLVAVLTIYFSFLFSGMGATAVFIKKFNKFFIRKALFLSLFSFSLVGFFRLILPVFGDYGSFTISFETLNSALTYLVSPASWESALTLFFLFCFVLYFKKTERKRVFVPALLFLFMPPVLKYLFALFFWPLFYGMPFLFLLQKLALPVSFGLVFLLYFLFSTVFQSRN